MATSFREWPWPLQALFYVGLAIVLVLAGFYVPGLPLATVRTQLESAQAEVKPLEADVQNLRVYKQRRAELQSEMDALQKQLATLADDRSGREADRPVHPDGAERGGQLRRVDSHADREADRAEALLLRDAVRRSKPMVRTTRCWTSSRGWDGSRESSMWAI